MRKLWQKIRDIDFREWFRKNILAEGESDLKKSQAVALGVFMSMTPIWSIQTAVALTIAHFLKLNKAIVIAAVSISFPPMMFFILYGSYELGGMLVAEPETLNFDQELTIEYLKEKAMGNLWQYVVGSLALASICGTVFGLLTYFILKIFRNLRATPQEPVS